MFSKRTRAVAWDGAAGALATDLWRSSEFGWRVEGGGGLGGGWLLLHGCWAVGSLGAGELVRVGDRVRERVGCGLSDFCVGVLVARLTSLGRVALDLMCGPCACVVTRCVPIPCCASEP